MVVAAVRFEADAHTQRVPCKARCCDCAIKGEHHTPNETICNSFRVPTPLIARGIRTLCLLAL